MFFVPRSSFTVLGLFLLLFSHNVVDSCDVKFAVIGDYGTINDDTHKVSKLVKSWTPDFIMTTGDNNYPTGEAETIDQNIGSMYSEYIYPYNGDYTQSTVNHNRFWPCLGNHDFGRGNDAKPYFDYFPALKNQFYYDFVSGNVHFFALCSDRRCPEGVSPDSPQLRWATEKIKESQAPWKIVYYHHPTYSSQVLVPECGPWPLEHRGKNSERKINLPFSEWGVSLVLSGHLHLYERFKINDTHYVTNGLGGDIKYRFEDPHPDSESIVRFDQEAGAMLMEATDKELSCKFVTISGNIVDHFLLQK